MNTLTLLRSRKLPPARSGTLVALTPRRARWDYVGFAVRQLTKGEAWSGITGKDEVCLVLLGGLASITWSGERKAARLGPRRAGFSENPHGGGLPPGITFEVRAQRFTEIAECRSPTSKRFPARVIRPADCGFEV